MPLTPEQEWTLVACGLVAHADGLLEIGEWDQVLYMLDEGLEQEDALRWVDLLTRREALEERLEQLEPPKPPVPETVLEKAWRMALADGRGSYAEIEMHNALSDRLGIAPEQVAAWRIGWSARAAERSEIVAGFAALVAHADGRLELDERSRYEELLERLPVDPERRDTLRGYFDNPPDKAAVAAGLTGLDGQDRGIALLALVPLVNAGGGRVERDLFLELAQSGSVPREEAERMLNRM